MLPLIGLVMIFVLVFGAYIDSGGKIEIILAKGITLIILAAVLSTAAGCHIDSNKVTPADQRELDSIVQVNKPLLDKINSAMDTLRVDTNRFLSK